MSDSFQERHKRELELLRANWTSFEKIAEVVRLSKREKEFLQALCDQEEPSPTTLAEELGESYKHVDSTARNGLEKLELLSNLLEEYRDSLKNV